MVEESTSRLRTMERTWKVRGQMSEAGEVGMRVESPGGDKEVC